ncbi:hypothetical protein [Rhodococcus phenolicus]|uniref:hypothetical protein n=1 Tax=Rhodococcus phenolicus TaxID=263849 RepID=UPI000835691F|nr:hypothetical protein [Rhodococcus phenolicus]
MHRRRSRAPTAGDEAAFMSAGDTLFLRFGETARPLAYGRSLTTAGFTCAVDPDRGVTCAARLH